MARQFIVAGQPFPVYVNATGTARQYILAGVFLNEEEAVVLFYLRPDADDVDGNWTNELGGTTLYTSIDESVLDDADYIQSGVTPSVDLARVRISNPSTAVDEPFKVRYRYKKDASPTADLTVRLVQGVTTIATWTHSGISTSFVTAEQTLTTLEFAAITDFDDLYIELEADS